MVKFNLPIHSPTGSKDLRRRAHENHAASPSTMTLEDFHLSLTATEPPTGLTLALAGLWWDAKGDWARAHESAQRDESKEGSWVHAYLHRKERDEGNAVYWYRAGRPSGSCGRLMVTLQLRPPEPGSPCPCRTILVDFESEHG